MATPTSTPCPDPSVHRDTKLQEQASTAALYATSPSRQQRAPTEDASSILDSDNKLSSKSAAMSLKHARAEDLPSYPSTGGVNTSQSSGAALLAAGNHKQFEHWKPDPSSAAAFKRSNAAAARPQVQNPDIRNKALLAATKSVSRARSGSAPAPPPPKYPDAANSAHNALNAATVANRPSTKARNDDVMDSPAMEQSRIRHISDKISREMWTDHPPVDIEVQEKKHQDALRASAVSMAKGMYNLAEQRRVDNASHAGATAATAAVERNSVQAPPDIRQQAMQYIHLQEAAHKLAEERLAKMDPDGAARYRAHYGYPLKSPRQRLSIRNSTRRRANSEGNLSDSDDEKTSRRIRTQMSQFSKELDAVDQKKRQTDRAALLVAAEKKVQAQMKGIDAKVFAETGKVSPAMMEEWEAKAREKAMRDSEKRTENFGKANIGGGRYMEQSEIEAIAAARLKPTLDEITENAEKRRAKDEEIRLAIEEKKRQEIRDKQNKQEAKELQRQSKRTCGFDRVLFDMLTSNSEEEKAAAKQEKEQQKNAARMQKEAEKERKAEEKRAAKEKRQSRDGKRETAIVPTAVAGSTAIAGSAAVAGVAGPEVVEEAKKEEESKDAVETTAAPPAAEPVEAIEDSESDDDEEFMQAEEDLEPIEPIVSRSATGESVLRPSLERHVTQIESSDSEDEDTHKAVAKAVAVTPAHPAEIAIPEATETHAESDRAVEEPVSQPLFNAGAYDPANHTDTAPTQLEDVHFGTDGAINKPAPEALDVVAESDIPAAVAPNATEVKGPEAEETHERIDDAINKTATATVPATVPAALDIPRANNLSADEGATNC
ncbi:hypothetical protein ANO11243_026890 [Dothideomycetidae sp. 11243]|nr:hypothetical protein ANO11243_026890 [fungal sp. No.11243]